MMNTLYFGDNLYVLRRYLSAESVDLIYLDPPFNSDATYNVLFRVPTGDHSRSQVQAFKDAWRWNLETERALLDIEERRPDIFQYISSLLEFMGRENLSAYLVMMSVRLIEMHRVLKSAGSIYLHCDPNACHYLKIIMDAIFGRSNFRNDIVWRRTNAHNKLAKQYGPIHDNMLFYSKSGNFTFHPGRRPYTASYVKKSFPYFDERGAYQSNVITGSGTRNGASGALWRHYNPTLKGRHWAIPGKLLAELPQSSRQNTPQAVLGELDTLGLLLHPAGIGNLPRYKQYLASSDGIPYQDIWACVPGTAGILYQNDEGIDEDVKWLDADDEREGYQTQKPLGLLNRIISTSSNKGEVILDPFCGCGTAVHSAQALERSWVGVDITHVAIQIIEDRLNKAFGSSTYEVRGRPTDPDGAYDLARRDKYQFQFWSVSMLGGQPRGGTERKGRDRGVDGELFFKSSSRRNGRAVISVKAGKDAHPDKVRELVGTRVSQEADAAIFVCVGKVSAEMERAAADDGFLQTTFGRFPRCQIVSVEKLFEQRPVDFPLIIPAGAVAQEAKRQTLPSHRERPTPEALRREPELPPMTISGGKATRRKQPPLPLDEPFLSAPPPVIRRRRVRR